MSIGGYRFRRSFGNVEGRRFRGARPSLDDGILDQFAGAVGGYSLRSLSSSATNVVRVRRSSDNAEQDLTAPQITDGTLLTFTGAGDGFVTMWYDQSGIGNDANQPVAINQVQIVSSGVLVLDNANASLDCLGTGWLNISASITPVSVFAVASRPGTDFRRLFSNNAGTSAILTASGNYNTRFGATVNRLMGAVDANQKLLFAIESGTSDVVGLNGVVGTSGDLGAFETDSTYSISDNAGIWDGKISEVIIWGNDQSANRAAIEADINGYYGIY